MWKWRGGGGVGVAAAARLISRPAPCRNPSHLFTHLSIHHLNPSKSAVAGSGVDHRRFAASSADQTIGSLSSVVSCNAHDVSVAIQRYAQCYWELSKARLRNSSIGGYGKCSLPTQLHTRGLRIFPIFSLGMDRIELGRFSSLPTDSVSCLVLQTSSIFNFNIRSHQWQFVRHSTNALVKLNTDDNVARFFVDKPYPKSESKTKQNKKQKKAKMSRKDKVNQLKWYRLKAKKKMKSPNPEVRIRYKLEKAKRKEEWLVEKLRKYEIPKTTEPVHDPEILTEEERFYLKRTGEKKKNYVPVGRRGVFGGVVLNMHLHWKKHETVKVVCKPCKPGQIQEYADELARLSKGTIIDIKANNVIMFYRGKNYVRPEVMSPTCTLSKQKAIEKYKFEQSLEHTSQFIEKLEKELEDYHKYLALYKKNEEMVNNKVWQ